MIRVIGIDPGLRTLGWGVIDVAGSKLHHVANGLCVSSGDDLAARVRIFANGDDAMAELAKGKGNGLLGCIQTTEIRFAPDVVVAGLLPGKLGLSTIYSVAVTTSSKKPEIAAQFISKLIGAEAAPLRVEIGFEA